ncbi:MAG: efflux RND transporter periplasmic adaptor subunit [Woeseiaceae bacterium]
MKLHRYSAAVLVCVFALSACQQGEKSTEDEDEKAPPVPVEVSLPVRGDVYAIYSGTAPIEAFARADVIAKVPGEVREILVEEGDDVEAGQILARLDGDRLRLELNESKARLRKLERDFQRNKDLREKGLVSEGDFDEIQYELEALQASYNLASLELDYTQIRAPISGVVSDRFIKLGNTLEVGDPVFSVTSLEPLVAYLHIPEREYRQIAAGQPVGIDIDALSGIRILAEVTRVSPVVDPDTGTFKITIEISDAERRIKPGMFGRMSIVFDRHENALQVPRSAVIEEMGATSVFVVVDNVAVRKPVTTGFSNNGLMEIIDGIVDSDNVVTVGQIGLKPDAEVSVINAADEESGENSELADASSDGES